MEDSRLFLLGSGWNRISTVGSWSEPLRGVLISTEIIDTIPFWVLGQFLRGKIQGRPVSHPPSAADAGHAPHAFPPASQSVGWGFPWGRACAGGAERRRGSGRAAAGQGVPASLTTAVQRPLLFWPGGAGHAIHGPGSGGEDGRGGQCQCVCPGGGGGAGPVHIHLEEEDRAEDQDHRDGECRAPRARALDGPQGVPSALTFPCWRCWNVKGTLGSHSSQEWQHRGR